MRANVRPLADVEWKRNVMAHAQKPDLVFQRNGRVHLYRRGCQFGRLLAAEVCASAVVMLDRPCSDTVQDCWLPTPFASFPITSPPVLRSVPPDSVCTLHHCERREWLQRHRADFQPPATRCGEYSWSVFAQASPILEPSTDRRVTSRSLPLLLSKLLPQRNYRFRFMKTNTQNSFSGPDAILPYPKRAKCAVGFSLAPHETRVVCISKQRIPWTSC